MGAIHAPALAAHIAVLATSPEDLISTPAILKDLQPRARREALEPRLGVSAIYNESAPYRASRVNAARSVAAAQRLH